MPATPRYRRILLKISGEALMGGNEFGLDPETLERVAGEVKGVHDLGVEICLVVGGGNIFRGIEAGNARHRAGDRRLHGHAGDGDERARDAGRARADRRADPRPVGDPDGHRVRALHPPPRHAPPGEGPGGDLRRRHRQPLLHHRHRRGAARLGNGLRRAAQGHQGRRRLQRRPGQGPQGASATTRSASTRCCRATSGSWTPRRSRSPAKTAFRFWSFRSRMPAASPTSCADAATSQ